MCLNDRRKANLSEKFGIGYKIFRKTGKGELIGEFGPYDMKHRPIGKWLHKDKFQIEVGDRSMMGVDCFSHVKYEPGWHIFLTRPLSCSDDFAIRKVKYRKGRIIGRAVNYSSPYPNSLNAIVADEIFIERANNGK